MDSQQHNSSNGLPAAAVAPLEMTEENGKPEEIQLPGDDSDISFADFLRAAADEGKKNQIRCKAEKIVRACYNDAAKNGNYVYNYHSACPLDPDVIDYLTMRGKFRSIRNVSSSWFGSGYVYEIDFSPEEPKATEAAEEDQEIDTLPSPSSHI